MSLIWLILGATILCLSRPLWVKLSPKYPYLRVIIIVIDFINETRREIDRWWNRPRKKGETKAGTVVMSVILLGLLGSCCFGLANRPAQTELKPGELAESYEKLNKAKAEWDTVKRGYGF